jgi:hypothetical protein
MVQLRLFVLLATMGNAIPHGAHYVVEERSNSANSCEVIDFDVTALNEVRAASSFRLVTACDKDCRENIISRHIPYFHVDLDSLHDLDSHWGRCKDYYIDSCWELSRRT